MIRALALAVFLVYLWWWTTSGRTVAPGSSPLEPAGSFRHRFVSDGSGIHYEVGGQIEWTLPSTGFAFRKGRFHEKDVCHGRLEGERVLARGRELYEYLRSHNLSTTRRLRLFAGSSTLQMDDVFYFSCRNQTIERLDMCPTGQVFRDGDCQGINGCLGAAAGTAIPDPIYLSRYYLCPGGDAPAVSKSCQDGTWFLYDACRPVSDFDEFCNTGNEVIRLLDDATRIECKDGKASFRTCPEGEEFYGERCESTACASEPEGTLLPLPLVENGPFRYSPGYEACRNGRVVGSTECPSYWNEKRARDPLTHLPLVFDGRECSVPEFCTNVHPIDSGTTMVPQFDFAKYVRNWKHSEAADGVVGFVCEGRVRKRKATEPGYVVSKRYRQEASTKTFLPDRFDGYLENGTLVRCGQGEIFDGASCRPRLEKAFTHNGLGLFRLAAEDWFPAWDYEKNRIFACPGNQVFLETWNACAPPNCARFPWLSKVNFTIHAEQGIDCTGVDGRIVESEREEEYDFWTQGRTPGECVPGNHISSGNFVYDSTVYSTCDASQPFVFCPYVDTKGIELVEGKRWCCVPKHRERQLLEPGSEFVFEKNELLRLTPLDVTTEVDLNNSLNVRISPRGIDAPLNVKIRVRTKADALYAHFRYRNTFPPDVVYEMGKPKLSNLDAGGAFLMKLQSFTTKPLALPTFHRLVDSVADFES